MKKNTAVPNEELAPEELSATEDSSAEAAPSDEVDTEKLAREVAAVTWDLKALNTVVIDLRGRVSYTDFVIVTTGTSERHVQAIAKRVDTELRLAGFRPLGQEGVEHGRWALLDYGDIIVHIFNGSLRQDYDLERMWVEAPRLQLEDKPHDLYGHFELEQFES